MGIIGDIYDLVKEIPTNAVLRDKLRQLEEEHNNLISENAKLKEENEKLKSELKSLRSTDELSDDENKILIFLSSCRREPNAQEIASSVGLSLTKTQYYLDQMYQKYIYSHDYTDGRSLYFLIEEGRAYLIENNLVD